VQTGRRADRKSWPRLRGADDADYVAPEFMALGTLPGKSRLSTSATEYSRLSPDGGSLGKQRAVQRGGHPDVGGA